MIEIENMIDERQQKLRQIADHYQEKQLWKLAEECGELVQALSKYTLTGDKRPVIEEIADVKNVAPQVEYLLGIEDDVEPMMEYKLDRTIKEVEEQQKKNGLPGADDADVFKQEIGRADMQELEKILEEIEDERADVDEYSDIKSKMLARHWNSCIFIVQEIIRKHMNDGWIPVEDDLPKDESEVYVVLESKYGTGYRAYSIARYLHFENYGENHWCDNHYGYLEWKKYSDGHGGCSQYRVAAWKPVEPYRPERRKDGQAD